MVRRAWRALSQRDGAERSNRSDCVYDGRCRRMCHNESRSVRRTGTGGEEREGAQQLPSRHRLTRGTRAWREIDMLGWRAAAATVGAATFAAAAYRVYVRVRSQPRRRIAVASTSRQKLDAAACALDGSVAGAKTESLVAPQPTSLDETMRGARNRLTALLDADAAEGADLAVAIENGLVRMSTKVDEEEEAWVDLAVVILRDLHTGRESIATSAGVQIPAAAVGEWAEAGGDGTVGEVLAEQLSCDKQDPHAALTKQMYPRASLIENAIRVAAASLLVAVPAPA